MKVLSALAVVMSALLLQGCIAAAVVGTAAVGTKAATDPRTLRPQQASQLTAVVTGQGDNRHIPGHCRFNRFNDIPAVTARGDRQQHVSGMA